MSLKLAISGKANSGKSTVATIVADKLFKSSSFDLSMKTFAFADPMKEIVKIMFPQINKEWLWGPSALRSSNIPNAKDANDHDLTCRQALLDLGKLGRSYNPNIWIDATIHSINNFLESVEGNGIACISDVRFKNEFYALKRDGFFICRIKRTNNLHQSNDISEIDLDDISDSEFDFTIVNESSLQKLENEVDLLLTTLGVNPLWE